MCINAFKKANYLLLLCTVLLSCSRKITADNSYDVVVYGATSAGVVAAYTAKMKGESVLLVEPSGHLGGLTTGGLGQTDIGNKYAITGISRDFYRRVGKHYGKLEQWTFEPHVAKDIFLEYLTKAEIPVIYYNQLTSVEKDGTTIKSISLKNVEEGDSEKIVSAKIFIDATYEGDLMAKADVSYTVGREANSVYGETWNGVQLLDKHQFPEGVDPYKVKGNPSSGLLWGVSNDKIAATGSGDKKMQAYNFRLCLTDSVENRILVTRPAGYDSTQFELLLRYIQVKQPTELNWALMHMQDMPGRKTDINNSGPFSTDMIGENYDYPDATYDERGKIIAKHKLYTQSLLYFLGNDARVPDHIRTEMKKWGYPKDEYQDFDNFSPQLYIREARRMVSDYVMTEKHCVGDEMVNDGIGMAAYTMDSHNTQRLVVNGMAKNEGDVQQGTPNPFPISYRSIIPKKSECTNLLVPVCLSASHIAFGSIRMEPVFMVLGQSAGLAAAMAIESNKSLQEINVKNLQNELTKNPLADNSVNEILLDNSDAMYVSYSGNWTTDMTAKGRYGKDYWVNETTGNTTMQTVTFKPDFTKAGAYQVYIYIPDRQNLAKTYDLKLTTADGEKAVSLSTDVGRNDWYHVGRFNFEKGMANSLRVGKNNIPGSVVADAVLFLPNK